MRQPCGGPSLADEQSTRFGIGGCLSRKNAELDRFAVRITSQIAFDHSGHAVRRQFRESARKRSTGALEVVTGGGGAVFAGGGAGFFFFCFFYVNTPAR